MLLIQGGAIERLSARELEALRLRATLLDLHEVPSLSTELDAHLERVQAALARNEFINLPLAQRIADNLKLLLARYEELSNHSRAWVIGAARVFLETHDVLDDLASPIGFDDDARILNAVLRDIGREDLLIEI